MKPANQRAFFRPSISACLNIFFSMLDSSISARLNLPMPSNKAGSESGHRSLHNLEPSRRDPGIGQNSASNKFHAPCRLWNLPCSPYEDTRNHASQPVKNTVHEMCDAGQERTQAPSVVENNSAQATVADNGAQQHRFHSMPLATGASGKSTEESPWLTRQAAKSRSAT